MDGMVLGVFLLATFIGGVASGLSGFAMGLVLSSIWLHIITPIQTTTLIVSYGQCVLWNGDPVECGFRTACVGRHQLCASTAAPTRGVVLLKHAAIWMSAI